ncbi:MULTISPECIES: PRTRC system protein C [unclassified Caballeronia]|uniref:PRTRC system protein C n=1 Tax=unclassified Caballeronia TaxID=2646786 RepID=UPI002861B5AB|nr:MULTISPECIES: PRTRC system protein C [unclassified Caballeronia]MDR5776912.1 PRTRC system protein C [Caballeronia sp. LZ002]MDR5798782.1 PRTRC system protein C [Caballeronia sp. LZ001]MDR5852303.1 PRTRC system protein C [Caballeronia sp. LZ003]
MAIQIAKLTREFVYNGVTFPDPGPTFSPDDVRDLYSAQYPELTTAAIDGPATEGDVLRFTFVRAVGAKGAGLPNCGHA